MQKDPPKQVLIHREKMSSNGFFRPRELSRKNKTKQKDK